ncbi:glycosyltransferase family 1 protein [Pedobacter chinensis]|uniref:Glycosyltransferase family 1 protein n=1 Tax=Pedobacter chinensis TaxID=2282421 RepID=A0A369Q0H5_9SPHI|nr:glycosyltransferase family 1 protein [Pedobacter chinensis]RDC55838.1 glycosyltransferase family 1 protein [Pedobacter chinensis]
MNIQNPRLPKNLLCFSHLRWDFVFQRPQHLMSRFARDLNVYIMEEPIFVAKTTAHLAIDKRDEQLTILTPHLSAGMDPDQEKITMKKLLNEFMEETDLVDWIFWYYTPMALQFSDHYSAALTVFDCMDELSAFDFAPKELVLMEKTLLKTADVVFTGGHSLHEVKKEQHNNIHVFPSSIDKAHFNKARRTGQEPDDQANIKGIKLGFIGVIDERFDVELIKEIALKRPEWQIILLGPVVKVSMDSLPTGPNLHYFGQRNYQDLPAYLSGWDIALIPFAINNSTRFISPTKTPEYLAAGLRVVSTPIRDVIKPYGIDKLVDIASNADEFIVAIERALSVNDTTSWLNKVDLFLEDKSWENTYEEMKKKMLWTLFETDKLLAS